MFCAQPLRARHGDAGASPGGGPPLPGVRRLPPCALTATPAWGSSAFAAGCLERSIGSSWSSWVPLNAS